MNVASLELCKELYALSGWPADTFASYYLIDGALSIRPTIKVGDEWPGHLLALEAPAYDLGYLLRKLPDEIENTAYGYKWRMRFVKIGNWFSIGYENELFVRIHMRNELRQDDTLVFWRDPKTADAPEDAAAKLAIELFKQDILQREAA